MSLAVCSRGALVMVIAIRILHEQVRETAFKTRLRVEKNSVLQIGLWRLDRGFEGGHPFNL